MFKRTYFFKVESIPPLRSRRIAEGHSTCCTALISFRSFLPDIDRVATGAVAQAIDRVPGFKEGEVMLTALSRV